MTFFPVIKDWSASDPHSHLEGGMKYEDGKLTVPKAGMYYIYAQLQFLTKGKVQIVVNDHLVSMISSPLQIKDYSVMATGSCVFVLNASDTISLRINWYGAPTDGFVKFWMEYSKCFFGAFFI